jgi:hypothetical protein
VLTLTFLAGSRNQVLIATSKIFPCCNSLVLQPHCFFGPPGRFFGARKIENIFFRTSFGSQLALFVPLFQLFFAVSIVNVDDARSVDGYLTTPFRKKSDMKFAACLGIVLIINCGIGITIATIGGFHVF